MIILTVGVSGSGKTTWTRELVHTLNNNVFIDVNRDSLRCMLFGFDPKEGLKNYKYTKVKEQLVTDSQFMIAKRQIETGGSVIVSDTNLNEKTIKSWIELAKKHDIFLVIKHKWNVDLDELLERNKHRGVDELPEHVIVSQQRKYDYFVETILPRIKKEHDNVRVLNDEVEESTD